MNYLLIKSLQISYENDPTKTIVDIADDVDMTVDELTQAADSLGAPLSSWKKVTYTKVQDAIVEHDDDAIVELDEEEVEDINYSETPPLPKEPVVYTPTKDVIKENLDDLTKSILVQARMRIAENNDIETKELKDLTQIVVALENLRYPKTSKVGFEVDLQKGIARFLAEVSQ